MSESSGMQILVVPDMAEMGTPIKLVLERSRPSDDVQIIGRADEALNACRAAPPDLIIFGWWHAGGMYAPEFCKALRADPATAHIPMLVIDSNTNYSYQADLVESGVNGHLMGLELAKELATACAAVLAGESYGMPLDARLLRGLAEVQLKPFRDSRGRSE